MNQQAGHTVKAFDDEMSEIRGMISDMGARAEAAVEAAMKALRTNDIDNARIVVAGDKAIDAIETAVERRVVQTIALRAPMADDLRDLVAALKMSGVIERIGDYAKNIAKRVGSLEGHGFLDGNEQLFRMADIGGEMVRMAMEAYARRDIDMARAVCIRDDDVDLIHKELFVDFIAHVAKHPTDATEIAHLLSISKNLERIGDHATTCAEMVYFSQTGRSLGDEMDG
ncbi:phosphate signaling complex protein PhoU [Novosphingopyxis sp.]|uniref:phosphate signaling complex protein PhoU n=1 Tax=Novosphingopyxis sp. TaxID=2709690 RepID=UPI003B5C8F23